MMVNRTTITMRIYRWVAALVTLAIGLGKKVYDKVTGKGHPEWQDLVADVVGIIIGVL